MKNKNSQYKYRQAPNILLRQHCAELDAPWAELEYIECAMFGHVDEGPEFLFDSQYKISI